MQHGPDWSATHVLVRVPNDVMVPVQSYRYSEDNVLGDNISVSQSSYIAMGIARGARPTASEKHKVGSSLDESHSPQCGSCPSSCHLPSCLLQLRRPDQPDQAQASAQAAAGNAPQTP